MEMISKAREQRKGRWIGGENGYCSLCGYTTPTDIWKGCKVGMHCPDCGAALVRESAAREKVKEAARVILDYFGDSKEGMYLQIRRGGQLISDNWHEPAMALERIAEMEVNDED